MSTATNKPSRQKLVVLGGVSVVGLAVVVRMMSSGPESAPAATIAPPANLPTAAGASPVKPVVAVAWPADVARDPFQSDRVFPPAAPTPPPPKIEVPVVVPPPVTVDLSALVREKLHLKATILGERPIAMMNGRVYRLNEVVEGFKIVEIEKNRITVERDGTRFVVDVK